MLGELALADQPFSVDDAALNKAWTIFKPMQCFRHEMLHSSLEKAILVHGKWEFVLHLQYGLENGTATFLK